MISGFWYLIEKYYNAQYVQTYIKDKLPYHMMNRAMVILRH